MHITGRRSGGPGTDRPRLLTGPFLLVTAATFAYFVSVGMLLVGATIAAYPTRARSPSWWRCAS